MFGMERFLTTTPLLTAVMICVGVYVLLMMFVPKKWVFESTRYTRNQLKRLAQEDALAAKVEEENVLRTQFKSTGPLARAFYMLPLAQSAQQRIIGAGLATSVDRLFLIGVGAFLVLLFMTKNQGALGILLSAIGSYALVWWYINRNLNKRTKEFLNQFPDALDMIVRSVRSGFPLNAAVNMVADTMASPIRDEFKQLSDEVAYGSTLVEALTRMGARLRAPDVKFFVVVLTLQQDVGGNLAEVLENLASLIRRRKMLRLKIQALTSEGKATMWVLTALPIFVFAVIWKTSPGHLDPLFDYPSGRFLLGLAVGMVVTGILVVRKMINLEV